MIEAVPGSPGRGPAENFAGKGIRTARRDICTERGMKILNEGGKYA